MRSFRGTDTDTCQPLISPCNLPLGILYEIRQQVIGRSLAGHWQVVVNCHKLIFKRYPLSPMRYRFREKCYCSGAERFWSVPTDLNEPISFMSSRPKPRKTFLTIPAGGLAPSAIQEEVTRAFR